LFDFKDSRHNCWEIENGCGIGIVNFTLIQAAFVRFLLARIGLGICPCVIPIVCPLLLDYNLHKNIVPIESPENYVAHLWPSNSDLKEASSCLLSFSFVIRLEESGSTR